MTLVSKNSNTLKRILIFSLTHDPFIGGAEIAVDEITERLPQYEFDMVTLRLDRSLPRVEKRGAITLHRIGFVGRKPLLSKSHITFPISLNKILFPLLAFLKANQLHRKRQYSGVWAIMAAYAGFAALFFKLMHPRVPYVLTLQEGDPMHHIRRKVRFVHPLWRLIFLKADIIQAISTYLSLFARGVGFKKHVEIVPNGVDLTLFSSIQKPSEIEHLKNVIEKRTHLSRQENPTVSELDDVVLVTSSRLYPKNGVEDIINSLIYLPRHISLLIIGDGPLMPRLKFVVNEKNLQDRVRFLGFIPHEKLPQYLAVSDVFIRPSISEGFGNSFIEAMAMKVPVIATQVGGIVDFVFDPYKNPDKKPTGLFCAVNHPKSIAYAVRLLLSDKKLRNTLVSNAYTMVCEKYDWNMIAEHMDREVFKKVIV